MEELKHANQQLTLADSLWEKWLDLINKKQAEITILPDVVVGYLGNVNLDDQICPEVAEEIVQYTSTKVKQLKCETDELFSALENKLYRELDVFIRFTLLRPHSKASLSPSAETLLKTVRVQENTQYTD
ncbi:hypothetical protein P9112_010019 [Eukaryota sp. TZLM1-RC]